MKYIKLFESRIKFPDINIGDFYVTDKVWISRSMLDREDRIKLAKDDKQHKRITPIVKVISIDCSKYVKRIICSTYFLEDMKNYTIELVTNDLKRKATPEEIKEFESTIAANKYNL